MLNIDYICVYVCHNRKAGGQNMLTYCRHSNVVEQILEEPHTTVYFVVYFLLVMGAPRLHHMAKFPSDNRVLAMNAVKLLP